MKLIVTHIGPDLDAITSIWLVKTFFPGWEEAGFAFVPAGQTLEKQSPDVNPEILHVDTGFGKFDHHQADSDTCAAQLVYAEIKKEKGVNEALERLLVVVNDVDHFREVFYPNPTADSWNLSLEQLIDGWRLIYPDNPLKIVELGMQALDGAYKTLQNKVWAEHEIKEKGMIFDTKWGKGLGLETTNDEIIHQGQKQGFVIVVRKDPKKGYLRVKTLPKPEIDLTPVYEKLSTSKPEATWYLHPSKHMLLNGSTHNPEMRPTKKSLEEIIEVIKEVLCN